MKDFFEKYADRWMPEPNSGCWIWFGAQASGGYGHGHRNNKHFYAHQAAYESAHGEGSAVGLVVRHSCDFPPCVNPEHLLIGTFSDNSRDAKERGRLRPVKGQKHPKAKLTDQQVMQIRDMARSGMPICDIRTAMNMDSRVGWSTVYLAASGERWPHLPGAVPNITKVGPWHRFDAPRGEAVGNSILTQSDVDYIRSEIARGAVQTVLAEQFGVSPCTISAIKLGRIWKHSWRKT